MKSGKWLIEQLYFPIFTTEHKQLIYQFKITFPHLPLTTFHYPIALATNQNLLSSNL